MLKIAKKETRKITPVKLSDEERRVIEALAKKYTGGNISEWIRYAAMNHKPPKKDLV